MLRLEKLICYWFIHQVIDVKINFYGLLLIYVELYIYLPEIYYTNLDWVLVIA